MLVPGSIFLGFQALVLPLFVVCLFLWMQKTWKSSVERRKEIRRLVETVSRETEMAEYDAVRKYANNASPPSSGPHYYHHPNYHHFHKCALCFSPTTTRCSRCKLVHYCSGKCQIIHWRQGHSDECQPAMNFKHGSEFGLREGKGERHETCLGNNDMAEFSTSEELGLSHASRASRHSSEDIAPDNTRMSEISERMEETKMPPSKSNMVASGNDGASTITKGKQMKSRDPEGADCKSELPSGKLISSNIQPRKLVHKKSISRTASSEMLVRDVTKAKSSPSSSCSNLDSGHDDVEDGARLVKCKGVRFLLVDASGDHVQDASKVSKRSLWKKFQQFKAPRLSYNHKMIFPYEMFVELYSYCEELSPFGLINCGNSCYANAVLQCLAFTRPLTSYLMRGLHSAACRMKEWCFVCELEILVLKGRGGESPLSPIRILSKVEKIGSHLGHGTEEDAHEFLRYAVDTMQSVFLKECRALGPLAEETTLIGLTFGGYLRSKITCMRCLGKSEKCERLMDLTVEVDGNIGTLDEAFTQFTADEVLDGENKYYCNRCKSYVNAKKKLTILEAPNVLTIVLKRFQSGNFQKLDKTVRFPEVFDIAPYMHGKGDKSPKYSLYAVVVHRGTVNDPSTGHYVCYVKNSCGQWFGVNDSMVTSVEPERVLLQEAYMLLYARHCPRSPSLLASNALSHGARPRKCNLEAVPSKTQQKNAKHPYRPTRDDFSSGLDDWRFHQMQRPPPMDSSSESSSIFSSSDASSCSTTSTKDSVPSDDLSDFLFGEVGLGWYSYIGNSSDSAAPALYRNGDSESLRKRDTWRQPYPCNDWR